MKFYRIICLIALIWALPLQAQNQKEIIDSLISSLKTARTDSVLVNNYAYISSYYFEKNLKKSNSFAKKAFNTSHEIGYVTGQAQSLFLLAQTEQKLGKLKNALRHYQQSAILYKNKKKKYFLGRSYAEIGNVYADLG